MPSHVLHDIFADECLSTYLGGLPITDSARRSLTLGAQGPDLFFHNRRTKPSGVFLGARMHRSRYGRAVAEMTKAASTEPDETWTYVLGFATHAILDRRLHPFINYFSGWFVPGEESTRPLRYMHPFFERVLDVLFCRSKRGRHPSEIDFLAEVTVPESGLSSVLAVLGAGLRGAYDIDESSLDTRIRNAYSDSIGFYTHSNQVRVADVADAIDRARDEASLRHWLALIHPPVLKEGIDYANEERRRWTLPCDDSVVHYETAWELYDAALADAEEAIRTTYAALCGEGHEPVVHAVGTSDLSSTRDERCVRAHSIPLPLNDAIDEVIATARRYRENPRDRSRHA